eukprot:COSAG02_NODE_3671_length_6396_cov_6.795935_6_plen_1011_part_00
MGASSSRPEPVGVLLLGLDAVGKTTLLWQMQRLSSSTATIETSTPTIGMNVEQLDMGGLRFVSWDVGGSDKVRPLWRHYFQITQGLIFVVDASDLARRDVERSELQQLLRDEMLQHWPLLVLANKQDIPGARTVAQITDDLHLDSLLGRHWFIAPAAFATGDGIEALDWMRAAVGAGKPTKRNWKALAANLDTSGELLTIWAAGHSNRHVESDVRDAEKALRPHLQRMADTCPSPAELAWLDKRGSSRDLYPGMTALHICALRRNIELAQLLLTARASVEARTSCRGSGGEKTALFLALSAGRNRDSSEVVRWIAMLLSAGADANASFELPPAVSLVAAQQPGNSPPHCATTNALMYALTTRCPSTVTELLLTHGADPNAGSPFEWDVGRTIDAPPLRAAIIHGDRDGNAVESVRLLVEHGASTEHTAGFGALMDVIIQADMKCLTLLLDQGVLPSAAHVVEAASKLNGQMPVRHFVWAADFKSRPSDSAIRENTRIPYVDRQEPPENLTVEMIRLLLERAAGTIDATVLNAAAVATVRALVFLTAKGYPTASVAQLHPFDLGQIKQYSETCSQVLHILSEAAQNANIQWSLSISCAKHIWPENFHSGSGLDYSNPNIDLRYDHLVHFDESDSVLRSEVSEMLSVQSLALEHGQMLPYPSLLHIMVGATTFYIHEEVARLALLPAAKVLVARGCNPNVVWAVTYTSRDELRLRRDHYTLGFMGPGPCDEVIKCRVPPRCTPMALAFLMARGVDALSSVLLSLPSIDVCEVDSKVLESCAKKDDGQCTLCDELLGSSRNQNAAAMQRLLDHGWYCSGTQAQHTLAALLPFASVVRPSSHRGGVNHGNDGFTKQDAINFLRVLLEDDRRCGEVFRKALSPLQFERERDQRPLTLALEYHDRVLLDVLLRAGAVVLPADQPTIEAMNRRSDWGGLGDTGALSPNSVSLVHYQLLILARQRLALAWSARSSDGTLRDALSDSDVINIIGLQLLTSDALRPGWLGRESSRLLAHS